MFLCQEWKDRHSELCNLIRSSKKRCREVLITHLDQDPWGMAYLIIRKKLKVDEVLGVLSSVGL